MAANSKQVIKISFLLVIVPLFVFLIFAAVISLKWRMTVDSPLMMYAAFVMDKFGYLPYRDFIDPNMLGTYFIYYIIGHFTNYTDLGFRIFDLVYLTGILIVTWALLKRINMRVALMSAVLYGINYFEQGPGLSLQREVLILLPLSMALLVTEPSFQPHIKQHLKFLFAGLLFGAAFLIKPHALIFFPVLIILRIILKDETSSEKPYSKIMYSLIGLAIPLLIGFTYLAGHHIVGDFWDIATRYWPRYSKITGESTTIDGRARLMYMLTKYFDFSGIRVEFIPAILGIFAALRFSNLTREQKNLVVLLTAMGITASVYPVFSNKFWFYHYWIFAYFIVVLGSLCLTEIPLKSENKKSVISVALMIAFLWINLPPLGDIPHNAEQKKYMGYYRTVNIESGYLKSHAQPGDKVQPLDWVDGSLHAMLVAKIPIATSIFYNVDLYHHISDNYTVYLRQRFMKELNSSKPRFIIRTLKNGGWITGRDTTTQFIELKDFVQTNYRPVLKDKDFIIYERVSSGNK